MSLHKKTMSPELRQSLIDHRLPVDKPSQLADAFRTGWWAAQAQAAAEPVDATKPLTMTMAQLREAVHTYADADSDTELCFYYRQDGKDMDGEDAPAGLYFWDAEYPEEGCMLLTGKGFDSQELTTTSVAGQNVLIVDRKRPDDTEGGEL